MRHHTPQEALIGQHQATLSWLAAQQNAMEASVIKWANINSGSGNLDGLLAMEQEIMGFCPDFADHFSTVDLAPEIRISPAGDPFEQAPRRSIKLCLGQNKDRRVAMTGHTDTVFPLDSSFQSVTTLSNGHFNGPGVTDMKGGILVMLYALLGAKRAGLLPHLSVTMLLSPDEETGSLGSAPLLQDLGAGHDIGLTYEPSMADGTLAGARKGSGNYTLVVKGRAAHAGREFHAGRNAVLKCAQIAHDLSMLTDSKPGLTLNIAVIEGGVAPNIVPDLAQLKFNVRLEEPSHGPFIDKAIKDCLTNHEAEGYSLALYGGINRPPKAISKANERLMDRVASLGASLNLDIRYVATGGCCEGNNLAAAGLPNIDTLGVRGGHIHSSDEYLIPESLSERARLSFLILASIAEGHCDDIIAMRRANDKATPS